MRIGIWPSLGCVFAATFVVGATTVGGAQVATAAAPNTTWCGLTCQGDDPYQPVPEAGPFHGVVCATGSHQVGATAFPREQQSPYRVDPNLPVSQWYSPRCQTTWAVEINDKAIGRTHCNFGVAPAGGGYFYGVACPDQGRVAHSPMRDDHNKTTVALTGFELVGRDYIGDYYGQTAPY